MIFEIYLTLLKYYMKGLRFVFKVPPPQKKTYSKLKISAV